MIQLSAQLLKLPPCTVQRGAGVAEHIELYERYLEGFGLLGHGFVFRELVRAGSPRHVLPPPHLWHRMVPTLALAQQLRDRFVAELGGLVTGLVIAAAYRPAGGEADSQHKHNAALDLDLLPADLARDKPQGTQLHELRRPGPHGQGLAYAFARLAAETWRAWEDLDTGLGTYAPARSLWSNRVHLDTGYRFRCWQGTGRNAAGAYTWARRPAALTLAPPDETDLEDLSTVADGRGPEARPGAVT